MKCSSKVLRTLYEKVFEGFFEEHFALHISSKIFEGFFERKKLQIRHMKIPTNPPAINEKTFEGFLRRNLRRFFEEKTFEETAKKQQRNLRRILRHLRRTYEKNALRRIFEDSSTKYRRSSTKYRRMFRTPWVSLKLQVFLS